MLYDMNVRMLLVGNIELGASKTAQQVKALANKLDGLHKGSSQCLCMHSKQTLRKKNVELESFIF